MKELNRKRRKVEVPLFLQWAKNGKKVQFYSLYEYGFAQLNIQKLKNQHFMNRKKIPCKPLRSQS